MKTSLSTITARFTQWLSTPWPALNGKLPAAPAPELTPKAAQAVADQEWEDEGGTIKQVKKPGLEPAPKIPL